METMENKLDKSQIPDVPQTPSPTPMMRTDEVSLEELLAKKRRKKLILGYVLKIFLILLTIASMTRVPFVGSYIDGSIDYIFGASKYFVYLLLLFAQITFIFHLPTEAVVKSKKFILLSLLATFCIGLVISGIAFTIRNQHLSFVDTINNYNNVWLGYIKSVHYTWFFNIDYVSGGILTVMLTWVCSLASGIIVAIIGLVIAICAILGMFSINYKATKVGLKLRGWLIRKLGGTFKYDGFNELKANKNNKTKFKRVKKNDMIKIAEQYEQLPLALMPDSSIDNKAANVKHARDVQSKINEVIKTNSIPASATDINVYTTYTEVGFDIKNKMAIQAIIDQTPNITRIIKIDSFNLGVNEHKIWFEIPNLSFCKICLKDIITDRLEKRQFTGSIGIDKQGVTTYQDFSVSNNALIIGRKASGANVVAINMVLSACYITPPSKLELDILNPNCDTSFLKLYALPHAYQKQFDSIVQSNNRLVELHDMLITRSNLLARHNVQNIEEYNNLNIDGTKMKNVLIVIPNFDYLVRDTFENSRLIADIAASGRRVGMAIILLSQSVNNESIDPAIYANINDKYILKLANKSESIKIFNNERGIQLYDGGDCLHYNGTNINRIERIQVSLSNQEDVNQLVDIIKSFYEAKASILNRKD